MSEGDANPVIYVELESGRTGEIRRFRIPEGSGMYADLKELLGREGVERLAVFQRTTFRSLELGPPDDEP